MMQQKLRGDALSKKELTISLIIIAFLFFMFGFISWINSILIPFFKIALELTHFESYFVTLAFYISYFIFSYPAGLLLKRIGFRQGIMIGFWIISIGAFFFIPAALTRTYGIFLIGLFLIGAGLALLQTTANPYVTILGSREKVTQRFSIVGICNKGAGIIAPLVLAALILKSGDAQLFEQIPLMGEMEKDAVLNSLIRRVILPYSILGVVLIILGILIKFSPLPEIDTEHETEELAEVNSTKKSVFQFPYLILGAVAIFFHVGSQVVSIDTIIGFADSMGIDFLEAKVFPSFTLTATIIGYLIGIICIPRFIHQNLVLKICTLLGLVFSFSLIFMEGSVLFLGISADISIWFLVLLGLPNALIWPGIWALALRDLGRFTKLGGSLLIMGLSGDAIVPLVYGYLADRIGVHEAYWVLVPCFLYLIFYAFYGYKIKDWRPAYSRNSMGKGKIRG